MKKTCILALAIGFTTTLTTLAIPITGEVSFDGTIVFNTTDLGSATTITSFSNERVSAGTQMGSYAPIPDNTAATFAEPINFTAFSGPLANLWQITSGGLNYSFDLNTLAVVFRDANFLNLSGQGIARITGFDATPGVWRLTAQEGNQRFSFSASSAITGEINPTGNNVPDGGSTVMLMGAAVMALAMLRRKMTK